MLSGARDRQILHRRMLVRTAAPNRQIAASRQTAVASLVRSLPQAAVPLVRWVRRIPRHSAVRREPIQGRAARAASGRSLRHLAARRRAAVNRTRRRLVAAAEATGTIRLRVRWSHVGRSHAAWGRVDRVRRPAATVVDRLRVRSWTCGSRSRAARPTEDIPAVWAPMADLVAYQAMAARTVRQAMAVPTVRRM